MDAAEALRRCTNLTKLEAYFKAHHAEWVETLTLEDIAGRLAWRTRVSECRTKLGMTIENKQERQRLDDGSFAVRSSYRYLEHAPLGPDASTSRPRIQRDLPLSS